MTGSNIKRFLDAQKRSYETALSEIRSGHKQSHWIWYIFPQIEGLGYSSTSQYYAIHGRAEAEAYWADPTLQERLLEISEALLELRSNDPGEVMGYPDDLKLKSSMTLFYEVSGNNVFKKVLDKFFDGQEDPFTVDALHSEKE